MKNSIIAVITAVAGLLLIISGCFVGERCKDGTFTGSGLGKKSTIIVELTLDDGAIKAIDIVEHNETEGYADVHMQAVINRIIEQNSIRVDTVSGATMSTQGLISAVRDAAAKAGFCESDK